MSRRASSASRPTRCGARTSSRPRPIRPPPTRPTIPATSPGTSRARRRSPTGRASSGAWQARARAGGCAASASRPMSRPAATTAPIPRTSVSTRMAASRSSPGRNRPGRATPPPMRRSSPIISGLPPERVRVIQGDTDLIATGTGTGGSSSIPCGGASVAGAAEQACGQAQGECRRRARSGRERPRDRRWRGARRRHRPDDLVRRSRPPSAGARARALGARRLHAGGGDLSQRHPSRRGRDRSRDRRDAHPRVTWWWTISARRSIRCCSPARCTAAPCRASGRR